MDYYVKNRARDIRIICPDKKPFQGKVAGYPPESQASCGKFYVEAPYKSFLLPFISQVFSPSAGRSLSLFDSYSTKRAAFGNILMLLKNEFLVVYEPGQIVFHYKEERIYFSAGPASGT